METVKNLKEKHNLQTYTHPLYGDCLVVPVTLFSEDLKRDFERQGHAAFQGLFGPENGCVMFLQLNVDGKLARNALTQKPVLPEKKYSLKGPSWKVKGEGSEEELLKAYDALDKKRGASAKLSLIPHFKSRSEGGIEQKLKRLLKKRRNRAAPESKMEKIEKSSADRIDDYIVELWNVKATYAEIERAVKAKFPEEKLVRSYHISLLQDSGRIKPRQADRKKPIQSLEVEKSEKNTALITEIPEVKTEVLLPEQPEKKTSDSNDLGPDIVKELEALSQAYDALSKKYVELKSEFEKYKNCIAETISVPVQELKDEVEALKVVGKDLGRHKHAVSGEAMLPMEASA